ncbi:MAG: cytochrome c [Armatimonadetes bacterium]|nr:cytochrome c [Armatimonadota bacterium]CUU36841.1 hypothetical protein DCOP10_11929 [Armatimonadetes bacterium DC]
MRKAISVSACVLGLVLIGLSGTSPRPAKIEVVSTFEKRCSSCHGKEGSLFEKEFEKKYKTERELTEVVESMPGAIGMPSEAIAPMVAYMRAISRGEPYLVWTRESQGALEGEVAPQGARIQARAGKTNLKVERSGTNRWRIRLPENIKPADVEFTLSHNARTVRLRLKDSPYTHAKP